MGKLRIKRKGGAIQVSCSGEMTLDTVPRLRGEVQEALSSGEFACLVMDLSKVEFMDSSGIGFLISLSSRVEEGERSFYLYRPSPQVSRTLDLVQLKKYFKVLTSEAELAPLML